MLYKPLQLWCVLVHVLWHVLKGTNDKYGLIILQNNFIDLFLPHNYIEHEKHKSQIECKYST